MEEAKTETKFENAFDTIEYLLPIDDISSITNPVRINRLLSIVLYKVDSVAPHVTKTFFVAGQSPHMLKHNGVTGETHETVADSGNIRSVYTDNCWISCYSLEESDKVFGEESVNALANITASLDVESLIRYLDGWPEGAEFYNALKKRVQSINSTTKDCSACFFFDHPDTVPGDIDKLLESDKRVLTMAYADADFVMAISIHRGIDI